MYLHVLQPARVSSELRKVLPDVHRSDLFHQQVCFVEEEDDGHVQEELVVNDGLKDVHAFHKTVGPAVLHQDLEEHAYYFFVYLYVCFLQVLSVEQLRIQLASYDH